MEQGALVLGVGLLLLGVVLLVVARRRRNRRAVDEGEFAGGNLFELVALAVCCAGVAALIRAFT